MGPWPMGTWPMGKGPMGTGPWAPDTWAPGPWAPGPWARAHGAPRDSFGKIGVSLEKNVDVEVLSLNKAPMLK